MIRFLTAGESHGKSLCTIVEGFPSNLKLSSEYINHQLKRRQLGYGRGTRMKIESDEVEILSGIRYGKTLGSPIAMLIKNNDWNNWLDVMKIEETENKSDKISIPRPGHADLTGTLKYNFDDIRNSIERSSARETAARVAAGSVARKFLSEFGIYIGSFVESIGGIYPKKNFSLKLFENKLNDDLLADKISLRADKSAVRVLEKNQETQIIDKIRQAKKNGDTLGGTFVIIATGVPVGIGSFMHFDRRLDSDISQAIMSINAIKGVEIGLGFNASEKFGSEVHDEIIIKNNSFHRKTNFAGGIEGGISTGLPIIVRAAMKPIATLMSPLISVDLKTMKSIESRRERSDFVAVPACSVIAESMLAWVIAKHFLEKFGGDSMEETKTNYNSFIKNHFKNSIKNFGNK
ncbi:MAG: chorismate synthase [Ignavibacterium sp.]|nr:chorismate synthase [Ignavibacterium sp.]MDW8375893.1 chorismate synthase [Ignavibacteriales bacterium]